MLLRHGPGTNEQTGLLIRALAEAMTLETGLAGEPMQMPGIFKPLITNTWLKQLWTDCLHYQIQIQMDLLGTQPNQLNNIELMRAFAQQGYCRQELSELNQCQMFLHVICLLDICDGTGTEILADCWDGHHPMQSQYCWPPTIVHSAEWLWWQQALQTCFGLDRWRHLS